MIRNLALVLIAAVALAGCSSLSLDGLGLGGGNKPKLVKRVPRERSVSPARAAQLINAHRSRSGAGPVVVDRTLNAIAAETARELARRDKLKTELHTAGGLARRLDGRYDAARAAENLGAGYATLAMTVEGWIESGRHNKNLVNREFTHMGIGLAITDKGQFHSYWVLILARPLGT